MKSSEIPGVNVKSQESCFQVHDDPNWYEETCSIDVHPRKRIHGGRTTQKQHGCDNDVGQEGEVEEHLVCE